MSSRQTRYLPAGVGASERFMKGSQRAAAPGRRPQGAAASPSAGGRPFERPVRTGGVGQADVDVLQDRAEPAELGQS